ncbi:hypothetical protein [Geminocystis sp.]|uniref:hypothetical protein n=1 Tax=Geminocystis sp. TaxID=2664100 RepID=UPI0035941E82
MYKRKQDSINLQQQVNQLYIIVKQLAEYVGWEGVENISLSDLTVNLPLKSNYNHHENNQILNKHPKKFNHHKDILTDDEDIYTQLLDYSQVENNISCDEQLYRLTAQLTAAYHRIASLEEELLALRNHNETRNNGFYHVQ